MDFSMPWLVQVFTYIAVVVMVVVLVARAMKYSRMPMHLRWDLYPMPHEVGKDYGGSYYEETDWWLHPIKTSPAGDLKVMASEILLHAGVWHHNRKLWVVSYPFHVGLYLSIVFLLLVLIGGIAQAAGATVAGSAGGIMAVLYYLTLVVGGIGLIMTLVGTLGVLARRLGDQELRRYSTPADYFNLLLVLVLAVSWLVTWLLVDPTFALAREFAQSLVTFGAPGSTHPAVLVEIVILCFFLLYLPFTHMSHFIGKWFTYHTVRWDDAPNLGGKYDKKITDLLNRPVSWSAPHMQARGGENTWAEVIKEADYNDA